MLDRLDGAVAAAFKTQNRPHNGRAGAFLDAMCDKAFSFGFAAALGALYIVAVPMWLLVLVVLRMVLHIVVVVVRVQDFVAGPSRAVAARSEGKFSTFAENGAFCVVCCALSVLPPVSSSAWLGKCLLGIAGLMQIVSLDMALRGLRCMLLARE